MDFYDLLDQVIALLKQRGRASYRALKVQFHLDDESLEALKEELLYAHSVVDDQGRGLVWTGSVEGTTETPSPPSQSIPSPPTQDQLSAQQASSSVASPTPEAERRQLSVLFCDLVDSTALASQLDPEDLRAVVRAYQETCAKVIARFEGHIAQYLGDGLLVYFGYPQAHEDDAQRAVRTGLGIVDAVGQLNTRLAPERGVHLAVRLGIHTGLVVVGDIGGGTRQEHLALGETPNLAARLQGLAAPNTVVISAVTFQLLGGFFACQPLGTPPLKGQARPLVVYRVLYESMARSRLEAVGSTGWTPLVGRAQESALLLECWAQVKEGVGQVVLLSGEAGIGKSRLVQVLREQVAAEPQAWLTPCQCSPYHQHTALYPLIELLERVVLRFEREESPPHKLRKLEGLLVQYGLPLAEVVPLFATLLALPLAADHVPLTGSPEQQKQQTLHALLTILLRIAAQRPVLFVMEDLHWVDPTTLEFLNLLVDQGPTARILALVTFRPDFSPPWSGRSHLTQVTLHRLTHPQAAEMVHRVAHHKTLPPEVVAQIVAKTDGVPLFVEELTKMVLESGLLQEGEDRYALTGPLPPLAIPTTLHDSLMARLDRLAAVKGLAQLGATLGREFSYELLRAVAPWDEDTLQRGLHQLVEAEFLYQRGLPPQATYVFKHALIQAAAYQSLLRSTRQQYHQRIAQALEALFPEIVEAQPELVAHHYTEAGLTALALGYWQRAGQQAIQRSAHREATMCFERGLEAVQQLPDSRATRELAIDLRLALRTALLPSAAFGRILEVLREAEVLATALDDSRRLGQVSLLMMSPYILTGAADQAVVAGQRALAFTPAGEVGFHAIAHFYLGMAYRTQGVYHQATASLGRTVAALEGPLRYERFGQAILPAVLARAWLAWSLTEVGRFAEGCALAEEGCQIAEAVRHPGSLLIAYWGAGLPHLHQGNLSQALPRLDQAVSLCQEADLRLYFPWVAWPLGLAYALAGRVGDALPLLEQAVEQSAAMGHWGNHALFVTTLGEGLWLAGRTEEARHRARQALEYARVYKERGNEAWALRLLGEVAAQGDSLDGHALDSHYCQALTLAEELGMRPLQAHCHRGLGMLYATTGQSEQACTELSTAIALYRAMEMTFWRAQAEAALAQVEGSKGL
jgi:class 3 adenylate cyclase/tetratricopeptide (TPR) repeat protein